MVTIRHFDNLNGSHLLTLKMTSAQVVEMSVTTNSPSQDYTRLDDRNLPTYDMTPGFHQTIYSDLKRVDE